MSGTCYLIYTWESIPLAGQANLEPQVISESNKIVYLTKLKNLKDLCFNLNYPLQSLDFGS